MFWLEIKLHFVRFRIQFGNHALRETLEINTKGLEISKKGPWDYPNDLLAFNFQGQFNTKRGFVREIACSVELWKIRWAKVCKMIGIFFSMTHEWVEFSRCTWALQKELKESDPFLAWNRIWLLVSFFATFVEMWISGMAFFSTMELSV